MVNISRDITKKYQINGKTIYQPDKDMEYDFQTTYSESSKRTQFGKLIIKPLFTVERYSYKASNVPMEEAGRLIRLIIKGKPFNLYHWSMYHNAWRTDQFYVGKGNYVIGNVSDNHKYVSEISFNMTGVKPLA